MKSPSTHFEILSRWPDVEAVADDIGVVPNTVRGWRDRNSISPVYWPRLVAGARRRGISLTHEELAFAAAARAGMLPSDEVAA